MKKQVVQLWEISTVGSPVTISSKPDPASTLEQCDSQCWEHYFAHVISYNKVPYWNKTLPIYQSTEQITFDYFSSVWIQVHNFVITSCFILKSNQFSSCFKILVLTCGSYSLSSPVPHFPSCAWIVCVFLSVFQPIQTVTDDISRKTLKTEWYFFLIK